MQTHTSLTLHDRLCSSAALRVAVVNTKSPPKTGQGLWARGNPQTGAGAPPLQHERKVSQSCKIQEPEKESSTGGIEKNGMSEPLQSQRKPRKQ